VVRILAIAASETSAFGAWCWPQCRSPKPVNRFSERWHGRQATLYIGSHEPSGLTYSTPAVPSLESYSVPVRIPMMPRRSTILAPALMAFVAQLATVSGLANLRIPLDRIAHNPDSACGCCPADRDAGRCCCSKPSVDSCCAVKPAADEVPSCCASEVESTSLIQVTWTNPVLRQQCRGPQDAATGSWMMPSMSPAPPCSWHFDAADAGIIAPEHFRASARSTPPETPPPRI
jgi:hypothetical protein